MGRVRTWSDARRVGFGQHAHLLLLAVTAAAVVWMAVIGHCVPSRSGLQPLQMAKPLLSSVSSPVAAAARQQLLLDGKPICKASKPLATAALPKSPATALLLLGTVLAGVAARDWLTKLVVAAGRGPPGAPAAPITGQDISTRLCLARR